MRRDLDDRIEPVGPINVVNKVMGVNPVISPLPRPPARPRHPHAPVDAAATAWAMSPGNGVSEVRAVNEVISQLPGKGLVQQRLLQGLQRGELPLVKAGEALGFFAEGVELADNLLLSRERRWK